MSPSTIVVVTVTLPQPGVVITSEASTAEAPITVADLGEFGLIAAIQAVLPPDPPGVLGVGDDAAVLPAPDGRVVATTDLLVEGRHFRRDWSGPADIGVKAAAQNLADVAAMGGEPTGLLVGLAIPPDLTASWVLELMAGLAGECGRAGATVAGGDVTSADIVMLAITALGSLAGRAPVTRSGAREGDVIAISGPVGESAGGLALLRGGHAAPAALISAHQRPQPDYRAGPLAAAAGATAMIDISDGLVADLGHIAEASGVRLELRRGQLPVTAALAGAARQLGADWHHWALTGGEDHALAATFPSPVQVPATWTVLGDVRRGEGVTVDGAPFEGAGGWDHFGKLVP